MNRGTDEDHKRRKEAVRGCWEKAKLERAFELAALDDREKEALRLYIYKRVPIGTIAERMGYQKEYFSRKLFKEALVKYAHCLAAVEKESGSRN